MTEKKGGHWIMRSAQKNLIGLMNINGGIHYGNEMPEKYHVVELSKFSSYQFFVRLSEILITCYRYIRRRVNEAR